MVQSLRTQAERMAMDKALVQKVISATCAICFIPVPVDQYQQDEARTALNIVGTAFLVRPTTVITNRQYSVLRHKSPYEDEKLDIGFIDFELPEKGKSEFPDRCQPLEFVDRCAPDIGEPIAVCGYPYSTKTLRKASR
jgi:hypothetical protein